MNRWLRILLTVVLAAGYCWAEVTARIGPYQVEMVTEPALIPVGKARLVLSITAGGKPVEGATVLTLTGMPGMKMGEKEERARPRTGQPGVYEAPAAFPMGGEYNVSVSIEGAPGKAQGALVVSTGQDTLAGGLPSWVLWLGGGVLLLVGLGVLMWRTGQRPNWALLKDRGVWGGLLLLAVMLAAAIYAVKHFRRPGAMTPIEAQVMEMNMPAPSGTLPVELATVSRGTITSTIRYSGQVVAYDEPALTARVTGRIEWMPYYAGDRVSRGEVLAQLDTTQVEPQVEERRAGQRMSEQRVNTAAAEAEQARAAVSQARAELRGRRAGVLEARAMLRQSQAELQAAAAESVPRREQARRSRALLDEGAISVEEFEQDRAEAQAADAAVRKARAQVGESLARLRQAQSQIQANSAAVRSAQQAVAVREAQIGEAEAGVEQAAASLRASQTEQGYAILRAPADGVITKRLLSPGSLAEPGDALLQLALLDPIRVQANVADQDLGRIQLGDPVKVSDRLGGPPASTRVRAIFPAVESTSRTGIVEAVLPNPKHRFLPGAFVTLEIGVERAENVLLVPSPAIVERSPDPEVISRYVWVADREGEAYTARQVEVETGPSDGKKTAVRKGLEAGWQVIVSGHQFLKEGDTVTALEQPSEADSKTPTIEVTAEGFRPQQVTGMVGQPLRLTFVRKVKETCATEVVFPDFNLKKELPLDQPVTVELTPQKKGSFRFTCGMDMLEGKLVVK